MKAEFNINCPLSLDEANEIQNMFSLYDIELYCGNVLYILPYRLHSMLYNGQLKIN